MANKLFSAYFWELGGRIGNQLVSFTLGIFLARILSPVEYGLIGMAMVFISLSSIFVSLGLSSALIQKNDASEVHYSSSFYVNVASASLLMVGLIFSAPLIASFFREPQITLIAQILSVNLLISSLSVVAQVKLEKELNFRVISKIGVSSSIISGVIALYLAWIGFGVWSLVVQVLLSNIIRTTLINLSSKWKPKLTFQLSALKELWEYSFNLFISGLINTVYQQLDSLIIARIFSPVDLGLYSRAKSLNSFVIKYTSESIGKVTFPAMTKLNNEKEKMVNLGFKTESIVALLSFGLLGLLYVTAEPVFLLLLGEKWKEAIPIYKILCLSGFAYPISAATLNLLKASGDSKTFLRLEVYKKVIGIIGLTIGFSFGLKGFLISLIASGLLSTLLNMYFTSKSLQIDFKHQIYISFIHCIPAIISSVIILSFNLHSFIKSNFLILMISTIIYSTIYLLANRLFKTNGYDIAKNTIKGYLSSISG